MAATHKNWQQSVSGNVANGLYGGTFNTEAQKGHPLQLPFIFAERGIRERTDNYSGALVRHTSHVRQLYDQVGSLPLAQ